MTEQIEGELCISPMCNLSEDELDSLNSSNASFAMWQPYKDKTRADEAEKKVELMAQKLEEYKGYKERALEAESIIRELSREQDKEGSRSRWSQCLTNLKRYADYQTDDHLEEKDDTVDDKFLSLEKRVEETEYKLRQMELRPSINKFDLYSKDSY